MYRDEVISLFYCLCVFYYFLSQSAHIFQGKIKKKLSINKESAINSTDYHSNGFVETLTPSYTLSIT